jgi:hypothetical protein
MIPASPRVSGVFTVTATPDLPGTDGHLDFLVVLGAPARWWWSLVLITPVRRYGPVALYWGGVSAGMRDEGRAPIGHTFPGHQADQLAVGTAGASDEA